MRQFLLVRIVSFTRSVPFEGIPHAGGEYYLRHVRALLEAGHEVVIVAPGDDENRAALGRYALPAEVVLIDPVGPRVLHYLDRFNVRFRVAVLPERLVRGFARDSRVRAAIRRADLLEYQWTEFSYVHGRLPRAVRRAVPAVAVSHDVLSQKFLREARVPGLSRRGRLVARAKSRLVRVDERRMLQRMRAVIAFSEKDAKLLEDILGQGRVTVVDPPLEPVDERWSSPRDPQQGEVLFVGAFYRPENADGAAWLLSEVWPEVREAFPDARLRLVGTGPSDEMLAAADRDSSIEVTGYVEDLVPSYRSAVVAVVPLHAGAGVKFKTVTSMLWGVPVVATPIGVEGIGEQGSSYFVEVTDDPHRFARAVAETLANDEATQDVASRAKDHAIRTYGSARFAEALAALYRSVSGAAFRR